MRIRCDGEMTRRRIIDAACNVLAQKGFRDATHEMICREAEANKAAINYHFGDKRSLYRAVWQHLLDEADRDHPVSGDLPEDALPSERLEAHIQALLNRHHGNDASWQLERLRNLERVNPTGLVDAILAEHHGRNREQMLNVLAELLDSAPTGHVVRFYETSALALCRGGWSAPSAFGIDASGQRAIGPSEINVLAKQITLFLLAGIETQVHQTEQETQP